MRSTPTYAAVCVMIAATEHRAARFDPAAYTGRPRPYAGVVNRALRRYLIAIDNERAEYAAQTPDWSDYNVDEEFVVECVIEFADAFPADCELREYGLTADGWREAHAWASGFPMPAEEAAP
jgi:hypothetical protein